MAHPHDLKVRLHQWKAGGANLAVGMRLVASYEYPDLTPQKLQAKLEALYAEVVGGYVLVDDPERKVENLNEVFFGQLKFRAIPLAFHDLRNSFLNLVLDTRQGMPLTLGVLYLLAGNHLGLPLYGVNLPDLFTLTYKTPETQFYVNLENLG